MLCLVNSRHSRWEIADPSAHSRSSSWVAGTEAEALTELDYPARAVFSPTYASTTSPTPSTANALVAAWYAKLPSPSHATQFAQVQGGAAGDPASLGVAWIVAGASAGSSAQAYASVVESEVDYLMNIVPRTSSGAISTRPPGETVQLW